MVALSCCGFGFSVLSKGRKSFKREIAAGVIGGFLSCWNTPFEVSRIRQQSQTALRTHAHAHAYTRAHTHPVGTWATMKGVVAEDGWGGLFRGIEARCGQAVWQTLFMQV